MKDYYEAWGPLVPHPKGEAPRQRAMELAAFRERQVQLQIERVARECPDEHLGNLSRTDREPRFCRDCGRQSHDTDRLAKRRGWSRNVNYQGKVY